MKHCIFIGMFLIVKNLFGVETFTEGVNPFNEYMNPENGVNLYSGDVSFEELLYTLPGRGGMNVPIRLLYSSNVHLNARARNDEAPSSWVGLGWRLGFGAIKCDHKGTKTHTDDEFTYISPEGVVSEIKKFQGLNYSIYHEGSGWDALPTDFSTLTPAFTGKINNFNTDTRDVEGAFCYRFEGSIRIATADNYTFYTTSDDGSNLYIEKNGTWIKVVNNDGSHAPQERSGVIELSAGYYSIRVDYFKNQQSFITGPIFETLNHQRCDPRQYSLSM